MRRAGRLAVLVAALMPMLAGCGLTMAPRNSSEPASAAPSDGAEAPATSTPTAFPSEDPNAWDEITLQEMALSAAELRPFSVHPPLAAVPGAALSGWTMIIDRSLTDVAPTGPTCLHILSPYTAIWYREYSYDLEADDGEEGHGELTLYAQQSASAVAEQAQVAGTRYDRCFAPSVEEHVVSGGASAAGPMAITNETIDAGVPSVMRLFTLPYWWPAGVRKTMYESVMWLAYGRFRAILDLWTCCGRPPVSDFTADVQLLGTRMRAASLTGGPAPVTAAFRRSAPGEAFAVGARASGGPV